MTDSTNGPARAAGHVTLADRRRFLLGAAALGLGAASGVSPRRAFAQTRAEITFASAAFFGSETFGDLAKAYNESQDRVTVNYVALPPPSSSTEVYQGLVQQLARRTGTPDVFSQDVIWIAGFAKAGCSPASRPFRARSARPPRWTGPARGRSSGTCACPFSCRRC